MSLSGHASVPQRPGDEGTHRRTILAEVSPPIPHSVEGLLWGHALVHGDVDRDAVDDFEKALGRGQEVADIRGRASEDIDESGFG